MSLNRLVLAKIVAVLSLLVLGGLWTHFLFGSLRWPHSYPYLNTLPQPWLVAVSIGCVVLLTALACVLAKERVRTRARDTSHLCSSCGYDLRGLDQGTRCPECGGSRAE